MSFKRFSLLLRVPLIVLTCSQLVYLNGAFFPDDFLPSPNEEAVSFDENNDNKSLDVGLPVVIFKNAQYQHTDGILLELGYQFSSATPELHATSPPNI